MQGVLLVDPAGRGDTTAPASLWLATITLADNFEVVNDDYQQMPLPMLAQRARASAVWLGGDVLHRSVPLPNRMRLKAAG